MTDRGLLVCASTWALNLLEQIHTFAICFDQNWHGITLTFFRKYFRIWMIFFSFLLHSKC